MTLDDVRGMWRGRTVACLASGPSLTREDCELVRQAGLPTIVVNTTFRMAPWAHLLFAMDAAWWLHYKAEVEQVFRGQLWTYKRVQGVNATQGHLVPRAVGNSGSYAISMAIVTGASTVLLLGYDCSFTPQGRRHWHPDHPGRLGNAMSIKRWPYQFGLIAEYADSRGVRIVNCSRHTDLKCFERGDLERELSRAGEAIAA